MHPIETYEAGQVTRWHSQPQMNRRLQTNADHCWGVAVIVLGITKGEASKALLTHALLHDTGERRSGDLSSPFKMQNPELAEAHKKEEEKALFEIAGELPQLTEKEAMILKAADLLEAMFCILLFAVRPEEVEGWKKSVERLTHIACLVDEVWEFADLHFNTLSIKTFGDNRHTVTPF